MKNILKRNLSEKNKIEARLKEGATRKNNQKPMISGNQTKYETSNRVDATKFGGIGLINAMVHRLGFVARLNNGLKLFKIHKPYHESDHVLNIAYNAVTGGKTLDDIDEKRCSTAYLNSIDAISIPDPTTAGDFTRRFKATDIDNLMNIINETRVDVWRQQPNEFFEEARIDGDGTIVKTSGETKQGMDLAYNGIWGYHPLIISLSNTQEPLFIVNRSGNRPSNEGAAEYYSRAAELCKAAGFKKILLRGDTAFSQSTFLDDWDTKGYGFIFGYANRANLGSCADELPEDDYHELQRLADKALPENERCKPFNFKQDIVDRRGYKDIQLISEDVGEFDYSPARCGKTYRMIVLRKNLSIKNSKGDVPVFDEIRYFFYITNRRDLTAETIVKEAGQRCNQENLIEQLKNGVSALMAPVNTLESNWAYMVMTALAWSFKAWLSLLIPVDSQLKKQHQHEKDTLLRMEFRRWVANIIAIPSQIIKSSRQIKIRLLAWNVWQPSFWRLVEVLA